MEKRETAQFHFIVGIIKSALKKKGISYRELGERIGLSESGVKKLFNGKDCSFNRLCEICDVIELPLTDLLHSFHASSPRDVDFTEKQQEFFLKNMDCFRFFWKLVYERWSVKKIQAHFELTERETFHYLKRLDEIGLIELHSGNRVKIQKIELIQWIGKGPLLKRLRRDWSTDLIHEILEGKIAEDHHFSIRSYQLTSQSAQELLNTLRDIDLEFGRRSIREMILYPDRVKQFRTLSALAAGSFVKVLRGLP
jgi:transcriptional regulator with XRE-family HTH domain